MRHFMAYHNSERMGQSLHDGDPFELLTNKPYEQFRSNTVWFIVGEGKSPKRYSLGSDFVVDEVGPTGKEDFKHYARGIRSRRHEFNPPIILNDLDWFPDFRKRMANFSLGVLEVKEPRFIESLESLTSK